MEDKTERLIELHDRVEELVDLITRKYALMFPDHYEPMVRDLLAGEKQPFGDKDLQEWLNEYQQLQATIKENNPWDYFVNQG